MNLLFVDLETTFQRDDRGRDDPSPYISDNYLVSVGWATNADLTITNYTFFKHNDTPSDYDVWYSQVVLQEALNKCDVLIAHNSKFELSWLKAAGFKYDKPIYDTMIREYVLARGQKLPLNLNDICERESLRLKKGSLVEEYLKKGIGFNEMPWEIVQEYGIRDVECLIDLFYNQLDRLAQAEHLWPTIQLMEEFCIVLTDIESNGIKIDVAELDRLEIEYRASLSTLKNSLTRIAEDVMGASSINLDSPEQLSQLIFSRKVKDKKVWKDLFNLGSEIRGSVVKTKRKTRYSTKDFVQIVKQHTEILYKTTAEHCYECNGRGKIRKVKKDGSDFSKETACKACSGMGYIYTNLPSVAGLRCVPGGYEDTAVGGFSTDKETLSRFALTATGTRKEFLEKILEVNKIETWLSTFIEGIRRGLRNNDILHTSFMQCVTATGRLSARAPNTQNIPRGGTFPIKAAIISRWDEGEILEADFAQLEFRVAGILSNDKNIIRDIEDKVDIHTNTAGIIGCSRQDAKAHSFAPLYGSSPEGKPEHISKYYKYFIERYNLKVWQNEWATEVINTGGYILPSGRELVFPNTRRFPNGNFSNRTQICNYRTQSFATADIVPLCVILIYRKFKQNNVKSLLILTVHDSIEIDVYPGELELIIKIVNEAFSEVPEECIRRWNYKLSIPLDWELKKGKNWLQLENVN